jgi:hypothetical protein
MHSIDARNQTLCTTAVVVVIGAEGLTERRLFHVDAIEHSERGWNEHNGKTGPCAGVKRECQKHNFQTEVRGMTDDAVQTGSLECLSGAKRNVCAEGSAERNDRRGADSQADDQ